MTLAKSSFRGKEVVASRGAEVVGRSEPGNVGAWPEFSTYDAPSQIVAHQSRNASKRPQAPFKNLDPDLPHYINFTPKIVNHFIAYLVIVD